MITPIVKINVIIPEITNAIADITIPAIEIVPANFNSAEAMWEMIQRLQD